MRNIKYSFKSFFSFVIVLLMITSSFITTCFATSEIGTSDETLTQYDPEILSAYEKGVRLSFATPIITVLYPSTSTSNYMQWTTVYGATSYKVYRSTSASGTYELVKTTTSKNYTDSGLTTGTLYYYKVEACSSSSTATSVYRTSRPCVVGDPYIYKNIIESSTSVTVKWTNVPDATKYYLYRSTSASGTYTLVATTTIPVYTNTGLTSGTTYYYKVRAYGSSTYGAYSTYSSVIPKE